MVSWQTSEDNDAGKFLADTSATAFLSSINLVEMSAVRWGCSRVHLRNKSEEASSTDLPRSTVQRRYKGMNVE